jgi:hypothetical protein
LPQFFSDRQKYIERKKKPSSSKYRAEVWTYLMGSEGKEINLPGKLPSWMREEPASSWMNQLLTRTTSKYRTAVWTYSMWREGKERLTWWKLPSWMSDEVASFWMK